MSTRITVGNGSRGGKEYWSNIPILSILISGLD